MTGNIELVAVYRRVASVNEVVLIGAPRILQRRQEVFFRGQKRCLDFDSLGRLPQPW
jgi:hypothetical protein